MSVLRRLALCCGMLLPGVVSATDDTSTLAQCAAVEDATVRLACYDALAQRAPTAPRPAPSDAFGKPAPAAETELHARIVGKFIQWQKGAQVTLDNGQVWKVLDDKSEYYPSLPDNPEVTITRGMTGYKMTIKAIGKKVGVRRVS